MRKATIQARRKQGSLFRDNANCGRLQKLVPPSLCDAPLHHLRWRALYLEVAGPVLTDPLVETHIWAREVNME